MSPLDKDTINVTFVANNLDVQCSYPVEIIPNYTFQKASVSETATIKSFLDTFARIAHYETFFEMSPIAGENEGSFSYEKLEPKDWKYYVIKSKGYANEMIDLQNAANLTNLDFCLNPTFRGESGFQFHGPSLFTHFHHEMSRTKVLDLQNSDIEQINSIYNKINELNDDSSSILHAIKTLNTLRNIHSKSDFYILGLFSIIEAIIAHDPKSYEKGDSIRHQVSTKIPLILHMQEEESTINYADFFNEAEEETYWKKLYSYRSYIAHGRAPDFKNELSILKNSRNVAQFVKLITKTLLRHAINDPDFYIDLQKC